MGEESTAPRAPSQGVSFGGIAQTGQSHVRRMPSRPGAGTPPSGEPEEMAQTLLDVMAAIRRTARRVAGIPGVLSSLTGSQIELVRTVQRRPGISVAEAAEELRLAPNTVSTLVGQLTDAGIIVRTADRDDRRVARLALSPTATRTVVRWYDRRTEAVGAVLARIPPAERRRLQEAQAVLATVAALLEEDATAAERAAERRHGRGHSPRRPGSTVADPR